MEEKVYFISSDIHSFFDEWQDALKLNGFDIKNPNHIIVICGDIFDRGKKPLKVYKFLKSLPKERRILIRGNHEILLRDLVNRGYPYDNDYSNGTLNTLYYLANLPSREEYVNNYYVKLSTSGVKFDSPEYNQMQKEFDEGIEKIYKGKVLEILDWINGDEWINYWETPNYIFVHSFIPINQQWFIDKWGYTQKYGAPRYREDWRNATQTEWEDATWGCPWKQAKEGLNQTNKTIVCGHWHTSDFFNHLTKEKKQMFDCPIFISKKYKLIGLDACTAGSKKVNCLVLKESEL